MIRNMLFANTNLWSGMAGRASPRGRSMPSPSRSLNFHKPSIPNDIVNLKKKFYFIKGVRFISPICALLVGSVTKSIFYDFTVVTIPKNIHQDRATQTKKFDLASASSQTDAPPV